MGDAELSELLGLAENLTENRYSVSDNPEFGFVPVVAVSAVAVAVLSVIIDIKTHEFPFWSN